MYDLCQLLHLIAVDEYKTFSKAAEVLHLTQPALSRSMKRLEQELDVSLFHRYKNKIELNDTGKLAVEYAKRVIDATDLLTEQVRSFDRSLRTLFIGICAPGASWEFLPCIHRLYSDLTISSDVRSTDSLLSGLESDHYQLIIIPYEPEDPDLVSKKLCDEHLMFSLPKSAAAKFSGVHSLNDMDGKTFLMLSDTGFWGEIVRRKMPHSKFIIQDSMDNFTDLAVTSRLPIFTTDLAIKHIGDFSNRFHVSISDPEAHVSYYCVCKKESKKRFWPFFTK